MLKKFLIASIILLLVLGVGYWCFDQMGGNNPVIITLVDNKPENLIGKTFTGIPQEERLARIFEEIQIKKSMKSGAFLHTIYEVEPASKLDTMRVFVGINQVLPEDGFEFRTFDADRHLVAKISANSWVMPGPDKIKAKLEKYAAANDIQLSGVFIDKIISSREVHVIAIIQ